MKTTVITRNAFKLWPIHYTRGHVIAAKIELLPAYLRPAVASIVAYDNFEHRTRTKSLVKSVSVAMDKWAYDYQASADPSLNDIEAGLMQVGYTQEQVTERMRSVRLGNCSVVKKSL